MTRRTRQHDRMVLEDGREVEPYTLEGYYDAGGNYIPGYYDEDGQYHLGYGYWDARGCWRVAHGYYDPSGEWVSTDGPVESAAHEAAESAPIWEATSDRDIYTDAFFADRGGETLEIAHLWGDHLLSVRSFEEARTVTLGAGGEADFRVGADIGDDEVPLVVFEGGWQLVVLPGMRGRVRHGEDVYRLEELARDRVTLGPETSVRAEIDGHTFVAHFTSMPTVAGNTLALDRVGLPYQAASAAAHLLLLLAAMMLPGHAGDLSLSQHEERDQFVEMVLRPDQEPTTKADWMKGGGETGDEKAAEHRGEETKAGAEESEQPDGQMQIEGPPENEETAVKKARDEQVATEAGVMGALQSSQVASTFGSADQAVGSDTMDAIGTIDGAEAGHANGFGGLGVRGDGRGGGGGVGDGVGIGSIGTGDGAGGCGKLGGCDGPPGKGEPQLGDNPETTPTAVPGDPEVCSEPGGAGQSCPLSKEIIRRVVRQHRREIRYCYEKELQANPTLEGRVVVDFSISPGGDVVSAVIGESTLNNAAVEQCMQAKIRQWTFPLENGKRLYEITYPFNFTSAAK